MLPICGGISWRLSQSWNKAWFGDSVYIGRDKWIPQPTTYKTQSPLSDRHASWQVNELIDRQSNTWNVHVLREVFAENEVDIIRKIPISLSSCLDQMVWRHTKDGLFTVKSAYHLLGEMEKCSKGQPFNNLRYNEIWSKLWKLNVPNATRMLMWRACH